MKKNIYKKCLKVLTKEGTIQTLDYKNKINIEDVLGFVLRSGKIVSKNIHDHTAFSENKLKGCPKELITGNVVWAKRDKEGKTNTESLKKYCSDSGLLAINYLGENEYLPGVRELLDIFDSKRGELKKLNLTRKLLGLKQLEENVYYWTSTVRDEETVWHVYGDGYIDWYYWNVDSYNYRVIGFLD